MHHPLATTHHGDYILFATVDEERLRWRPEQQRPYREVECSRRRLAYRHELGSLQ
jgi:hypothetical protein